MSPQHTKHPPTTPLWSGIHCLSLPLTAVWGVLPEAGPVAVHDECRGRPRVVQVSRTAQQAGVRAGQALSSALAIVPALQSRPRNRRMEAGALEQIALTAYGHSHQVVLVAPDTVLLEIAGSRRLRGSTDALLDLIDRQLGQQGFNVRIGTAIVPAAACLLARLGQHCHDRAGLRRLLAELPLSRLELAPEQHRALAGCGLDTIGDLLRLPAPERTRRFGRALDDYLRRLCGEQATLLETWQPPDEYRLRLELPTAIADSGALLFMFRRALDHLGTWIEVRDRALTRLRITLEREDGGTPLRFAIGLARPGMDRKRLLELIGLKLESLRLPAPVDALSLKADSTAAHRPPQADLFSGHNRADAWPALLDRLCARLGENGLSSLAPCADHRPEKAWIWTSPGTTAPGTEKRRRPTWLLPEPRPCRREHLRLEEGPERIESGWWDGRDCRRDYWVARDRQGRRVWVFREHKPRCGWFLHGIFG